MTNQNKAQGLDIRIQLDPEHKVIGISLNDAALIVPGVTPGSGADSGCSPESPPPAAEADCCTGAAASTPPAAPPAHGEQASAVEGRRILTRHMIHGLVTLSLLFLLHGVAYWFYYRHDPAFLPRMGWWIFYLDVTVVSLVAALGYLRSYRYANVHHGISMMIGMTVGMQVGMMTGSVLGATNGFFIGAMVGMGLGSICAVTTSWCCGPMAVTQGLMAGVMGGTMGAMILAMMSPEKILLFMPAFTLLNVAILVWFSYLFYTECVITRTCALRKPMGLAAMLGISVVVVGALGSLMLSSVKGNSEDHGHAHAHDPAAQGDNPFSVKEAEPAGTATGGGKAGAEMSCGGAMKKEMDDAAAPTGK